MSFCFSLGSSSHLHEKEQKLLPLLSVKYCGGLGIVKKLLWLCKFIIMYFIIWQGSLGVVSGRSDWFFLGRDFAIRTVSMEMVIRCVFFVFESRQFQNKHYPSAI